MQVKEEGLYWIGLSASTSFVELQEGFFTFTRIPGLELFIGISRRATFYSTEN